MDGIVLYFVIGRPEIRQYSYVGIVNKRKPFNGVETSKLHCNAAMEPFHDTWSVNGNTV